MLCAVRKPQDEHPASSFPGLLSFPDVAVLAAGRVVAQTASARVDCFLDHITRLVDVTRNGAGSRIAGREDCQTLIAAERELDRNRTACRGRIDGRQVVDRLV